MRISTDFGDAQQWAQTHFDEVWLGDVRRTRRASDAGGGLGA